MTKTERTEKVKQAKVNERIKLYAAFYAASVCRDVVSRYELIEEFKVHPDRNQDGGEGQVKLLEGLLYEDFHYLAGVLSDIEMVKT